MLLSQFAKAQQDEVLSPKKIIKLLPNKIKGYYQSSESKSKLIAIGTIRYSLVEKIFSSGRKEIKVLLFDYKEAPIMYNQATGKWNAYKSVISDSLIIQPVIIDSCNGWETYYVHRNNSQIVLGIYDRFFLQVEGKKVNLESLRQVVSEFRIDLFPK